MQKHKRFFVPAVIFFFFFCFYPLVSCKDPVDDNVPTHDSDTPSKKTLIEFNNLEEFPVTIYSDSLRNNVFAEVAANSTKTVSSNISSTTVTPFYPTFNLLYPIGDPVIRTLSIPYNGPSFVHNIEANKTTTVPIEKLKSIYINSSYLLIINKSNHSLSLSDGGANEKAPLNGDSPVINSGQNAAYSVLPGSVSNYLIMINTITPTAFPSVLTEFKQGIIHVVTYNDTGIVLIDEKSLLQKIPPDTPKNVRIEDITANSVQITWDAVYSATSYRVYRATDSATSTYSQIANTTALSWTDTGISTGKTYYYKVSAVSGINMVSEQSATVAAIMPPANVRVSDETTISLILRWNAVSGASGYNIYRSNNEGETYSKVNSAAINGISFTDTGLSSGMRYYYKVSVIIDGVEGVQSAPVSTVTLSSIPTNLRITAATNTSVNIVWNSVREASGYYIYRSTNENGTYTKINSSATSGTAFTDTSVSAYTIYYYKVSAIVGGIESGMSSFVSASTGIIVPGNGLAAKLAWLKSNVVSNQFYLIEITTDENIVPQTLYYSNKSDITITLSGGGSMRTVNLSAQGSLFTINSGVTLILNNNITLNGRSGNNDSLVCIISGTLIMNAGTKIIGNSFAGNDYSYGSGGGVNVYNGIFTMNGGEISGNTAQYGSAVFVKSSDFTMNDGEISGNTASNSGGAVYNDDGYFTMNGGKISGNTAKWGGGIYINDASFNMNGGKITNNTASGNSSSRGGGVCISGGAFQMKDGEIFKNNTTGNGGGVYIGDNSWAGIFKIAGGVIYGNNTTADLKNTAANGTALYKNSSTAQYGTFNGNNFYRSGDLTTTNTTIRVVNGDLLTE